MEKSLHGMSSVVWQATDRRRLGCLMHSIQDSYEECLWWTVKLHPTSVRYLYCLEEGGFPAFANKLVFRNGTKSSTEGTRRPSPDIEHFLLLAYHETSVDGHQAAGGYVITGRTNSIQN